MAVVLETSHQKRHCCYPAILNSVFLTLAIGRMATVRHFTNWTILQTLCRDDRIYSDSIRIQIFFLES